MAAESLGLGQLRHIPSSSSSSVASVEPCSPFTPDPLQGLVQEMALSAVMQKHGSSVPSTVHSTHTISAGAIKNYVVPAQASNSLALVSPSPADAASAAQNASLMQLSGSGGTMQLGGAVGGAGSMQQGFIALSSAQAGNGNMSLLGHPQASPVLQGPPLAMSQLTGQLHEVGNNAANMMQFTPVCCYEGTGSAQPSPVVERASMVQQNFVGLVHSAVILGVCS